LSPIAASDRIRNGIIIVFKRNCPPKAGIATKAMKRISATP